MVGSYKITRMKRSRARGKWKYQNYIAVRMAQIEFTHSNMPICVLAQSQPFAGSYSGQVQLEMETCTLSEILGKCKYPIVPIEQHAGCL